MKNQQFFFKHGFYTQTKYNKNTACKGKRLIRDVPDEKTEETGLFYSEILLLLFTCVSSAKT